MSNIFKQLKAKLTKNSLVESHKNLLVQGRNYKVNVLLLLGVVLVGGLYLVEVNGLSTKGYRIHELEKSKARLQEENQRLSIHVTEARSLASLQKKIDGFAMVRTDRADYVVGGQDVAIASR